jgi:hypothetical protein
MITESVVVVAAHKVRASSSAGYEATKQRRSSAEKAQGEIEAISPR